MGMGMGSGVYALGWRGWGICFELEGVCGMGDLRGVEVVVGGFALLVLWLG